MKSSRIYNMGCDSMIYNKKCVLGFLPQRNNFLHRDPETSGIFWKESYQGVFCYVNEMPFRMYLRIGTVFQWSQPCEFSV